MNINKLIPLAFGLLMATGMAAIAGDESPTLAKIQGDKKIVIMNDLSAAPWQFRDANGNAAGFSIDLDRMIAARLDVDLELRNVEWAGLIPGLLTRKSDILATSMTVTPKRAEQILFTQENWYSTGVVAIVRSEDAGASWEDLNQSGKRIAVKAGTSAVDVAKQFFANAEIESYPNDTDTYQALKTNRVDAALNDLAVLGVVHREYGFQSLKKPRELISSDNWAFAVRKDDVGAQKYLDTFLAEIKANGKLEALRAYWVDGDDWKKDFLEKNSGVSDARKKLVEQLGIAAYVPESGKGTRATLE
ncbi:ABC transporter substrate-binding protein [Mesorhizobium sp. BAC0120]|uniref:substrate-binding periplasmic protein n=1 Tax=Mesorhizobium sp. BAC0120 TaxID=3090670 RepID=UPI00298D4639|nr:ABC transporter substrate-binding protein [Mesorhizobium sp. BAC0120]MDW6024985.1 ABC transporter substrate-binding protein [Mesorhizobium sp. BAC0120]